MVEETVALPGVIKIEDLEGRTVIMTLAIFICLFLFSVSYIDAGFETLRLCPLAQSCHEYADI